MVLPKLPRDHLGQYRTSHRRDNLRPSASSAFRLAASNSTSFLGPSYLPQYRTSQSKRDV
eukprot:1510517-Rhodomonas_salina.1